MLAAEHAVENAKTFPEVELDKARRRDRIMRDPDYDRSPPPPLPLPHPPPPLLLTLLAVMSGKFTGQPVNHHRLV